MSSQSEHSESIGGLSERELNLLSELQRTPRASQRLLSRRLGIALGMTNLLLHNLAQRGYLRISQTSWRRWQYALTPAGLMRKVRLTTSYIHRFLGHYQKIRIALKEELEVQPLTAESRVAIYETGEFAELVYLGLRELGIEEIEVFSGDNKARLSFLGMTIQSLDDFRPGYYDRIIIATLGNVEKQIETLLRSGADPGTLVTFFSNPTPLSITSLETDDD